MKRILFVDDETNILSGLRRMLRDMRKEWAMAFVESGAQALELLARERFDIVVSDMRMPGMDGAALLARVREQYPHMVRIVLSGHSDQQLVMKSVKVAHQFLAKPSNPDQIRGVLNKACLLSSFLHDEALVMLVSRLEALPALPGSYWQLMRELESPDASTKSIGEIIGRDIGMTTTILKLVNSSFFGLARQITNPSEAVGLLGLDVIQGLAVSSHVFAALNVKNVLGFSFEDLWVHCLNAAGVAKYIAHSEGWSKELVDVSFLGGLLHDVGKLVLASVAGDQYNQTLDKVRANNDLIWRAEKSVLGTTHAEVGAYLLGLWGMPDAVVEAIAFHHYPSQSPNPDPSLLAVHAANFIEHECRIFHVHYCKREVDGEFLRRTNVEGKLAGWLKRCESLLQSGEQS